MKALRWYAAKDVRYEDVPEPFPGPGQVKVKVNLAGICGTDLKEYVDGPSMIDVSKVPLTLGHEFAGRVVEVGEEVTEFEVGDRVTALGYWYCGECYFCKRGMYNICQDAGFTGLTSDGCMAAYVVVPGYAVYKLPDLVSDEAGALVEPLAVALHAVRRGNVHLGDTVGIVGDGTIGLCTLLAARLAGASKVYVVSKHKGKEAKAMAMGATRVVNVNSGGPVELVKNLTGGLGADVVFECVGRPESAQLAVELVRSGGTVVIVGVFDKPGSLDFQNVMFNEKSVIGSSIYTDEARVAIDLINDGRLDPTALITSRVPLENAVESGFGQLISNKDNIKILLEVP
ncbi:MAG: 2,3-butanediol dehydrogenase [Chloroflexota bacterium]